MARTWVTDAQVLDDEGVIRGIENTVLLRTPAVERFLGEINLPSTAVVGPKGFGKTFALKLKRILLQEDDFDCLPHGIIVDRPPANPPHLSAEEVDYLKDQAPWAPAWQIALALAALKGHRQTQTDTILAELQRNTRSSHLKLIIQDVDVARPFQIIDRILRLNRKAIAECISDATVVVDAFSQIRGRIALFADNIDEYMDGYLDYDQTIEIDFRKRLKMWHRAQIGAWAAVRQLNGINPHVKIFISIRIEAFHFAQKETPQFANLKAFSIELKYTQSDLVSIIENNIRAEPRAKLVDPEHIDPMGKFVGDAALSVVNAGTGEVEDLTRYWLRHCIGRPRDAVSIGETIADVRVRDRIGVNIRAAINEASADLVESLFGEAQQHLRHFDSDLLAKIITKNVLSEDEVKSASIRYDEFYVKNSGFAIGNSGAHVFCSLYALGLIGIVQPGKGVAGAHVQNFPEIGRFPLGAEEILPIASEYLIHPALSDFIGRRDAGYLSRLDRYNIIGNDRTWRSPDDYVYVAVGDIKKFRSQVMAKSGPAQAFDHFWKATFSRTTKGVAHRVAQAGDMFILADPSPVKVIRASRNIARALKSSQFALDVRIGAHSGFWRLNADEDRSEPQLSEVVGVAARIEPLAEASWIYASEQFVKGIQGLGNAKVADAFSNVEGGSSVRVRDDGTVRISKSHEAPQFIRLFRTPAGAEGHEMGEISDGT